MTREMWLFKLILFFLHLILLTHTLFNTNEQGKENI